MMTELAFGLGLFMGFSFTFGLEWGYFFGFILFFQSGGEK